MIWYGNAGSEQPRFGMVDLGTIIPFLNKVNLQHPLKLTVVSNSEVSFQKYVKAYASFEVCYIPWAKESFEYIIKEQDLCLIPVQQNPFTSCKTNNRVVLTLLLGVPILADPIPSYEEFSPFISLSDWEKNLVYFIEHKSLFKDKVKKGQVFISDKYSTEKIKERWKSVLKEIVKVKE